MSIYLMYGRLITWCGLVDSREYYRSWTICSYYMTVASGSTLHCVIGFWGHIISCRLVVIGIWRLDPIMDWADLLSDTVHVTLQLSINNDLYTLKVMWWNPVQNQGGWVRVFRKATPCPLYWISFKNRVSCWQCWCLETPLSILEIPLVS